MYYVYVCVLKAIVNPVAEQEFLDLDRQAPSKVKRRWSILTSSAYVMRTTSVCCLRMFYGGGLHGVCVQESVVVLQNSSHNWHVYVSGIFFPISDVIFPNRRPDSFAIQIFSHGACVYVDIPIRICRYLIYGAVIRSCFSHIIFYNRRYFCIFAYIIVYMWML